MSDKFTPRAGAVFSADIAVENQEQVLNFYDKVLGTGDKPFWGPPGFSSLGFPILGIGSSKDYPTLPQQWCIHIQVENVGASVQRALARGGTLILESTGEDGVMQWAVLRDPAGAVFGLLPVAG